MVEDVVAQSNWLDFEVRQSTPEQRKDSFEKQRARNTRDAGECVGDLLPSLLANAPDPQALEVVLGRLYSTELLIHACALGNVPFFGKRTSALKWLIFCTLVVPMKGWPTKYRGMHPGSKTKKRTSFVLSCLTSMLEKIGRLLLR
jgi:hypothetical protein